MSDEPTHIVERAFQIARSGSCATIQELRDQLKRERYTGIDSHLSGHSIRRQLTLLMKPGPPA